MSAPTISRTRRSHLARLEAESIFIMREVAAEFANPVMLYSIGKDSSVMLHLAMKAFYPSKPPFPLMHVDTTWKFREMIAFRDETAKRLGVKLIVYVNEDGVRRGINPFDSGSNLHTQVMKTDALKAALDKYGFDAAFGGARRDVLIAAAIVWSTWGLLRDSVALALNAVPEHIDPRAVRGYLSKLAGVTEVHDLHIWAMSTTETALTAHLVMPGGHPGDDFTAEICKELRVHYHVHHATIQIETGAQACELAPDHVV